MMAFAFSLKGKGSAGFPTRSRPSLLTHKSVHRTYKKITSDADENDRWNGPQ
jgi:NADH:ubiquinone oxidoreductase subunit F (NADH-binding)